MRGEKAMKNLNNKVNFNNCFSSGERNLWSVGNVASLKRYLETKVNSILIFTSGIKI